MTEAPPAGLSRTLRQQWLAVLANAPADELKARAHDLPSRARFETLRAPEVGLLMVRGRIGNRGDRFNLGEVSLARCVVKHLCDDEGPAATLGVGMVVGRDLERARWQACADALLQTPRWQSQLMDELIDPLNRIIQQRQEALRQQTARTRVRFFDVLSGGPQ